MSKAFIPVMLTPFTEAGEIDFDGLTELTEHYLRAGAKGLFANCLSSEMYELSEDERLQLIRHVLKVADGRVPVVATGTFERNIPAQAAFIKKVHELGTEAVIVITSMMAEADEDDEVLNRNMHELIRLTDNVPLGFYECPRPYKRLLSASQLQSFVETGRIKYHKDTCLDIVQVREKIAACAGYEFGLYDAYMVNAVASMSAGAAGLSCIQGNYFPALVVWLCDNYDRTDISDEINAVEKFFSTNMDVMHDYYPFSAKYCLQKQGLKISTICRTIGAEMTPEILEKFDQLMEDYQHISHKISLAVES